jgi:copper chaperone CopZ
MAKMIERCSRRQAQWALIAGLSACAFLALEPFARADDPGQPRTTRAAAADSQPSEAQQAQDGPATSGSPNQASTGEAANSSPDKGAGSQEVRQGQPETATSEAGVPGAAPGALHQVQMRLSGSTCVSCLMELEKKLKTVRGVSKVKIGRPGEAYFAYRGPPVAPWSEATITYDPARVTLEAIVAVMKTQGYHAYKIVHKEGR